MSEPTRAALGSVALRAEPGSMVGVPAAALEPVWPHRHTGLGGGAVDPAARVALREVQTPSALLRGERVTDGLSARVRTRAGRVEGDLAVGGGLVAERLEAPAGLGLWRAGGAPQLFTAVCGGPHDNTWGYCPVQVDLPATGPGRLLVSLTGGFRERGHHGSHEWSQIQPRKADASLALHLLLEGEHPAATEALLLPVHLGGLGAEVAAALARAPDFSTWRAARPTPTAGGWLPTLSSAVVPVPVSVVCWLPAPQQGARVRLLEQAHEEERSRRWLLQVVFLPQRGSP